MNKKIILGDIHNDNAVSMIEKDGIAWIDKPRDARTELTFKAFLKSLEEKGFLFVPDTVEIIDNKESSHKVKVVEQTSAKSEKEVCLYYKKCGSLIALAYLLRSTDMHKENIIASGNSPVIVDYETLLSGKFARDIGDRGRNLTSTVMESHLLPHWNRFNDEDIDNGGLTGESENILRYEGRPTFIYHYLGDVLEGFLQAYTFFLKNKDYLKIEVECFNESRFRVLLRPTEVYASIIAFLSRQVPEKRELYANELLKRAYILDIDPERIKKAQKILEAEVDAVLKGEIPLFYVYGNGRDLFAKEKLLETETLSLSPVENAINRLEKMSKEDCNSQMRIISQAIMAICPRAEKINTYTSTGTPVDIISAKLKQKYIAALSSGWIFLNRDNRERLYMQSVGYGLYNGLVGILCYFTALYCKSKNQRDFETIEKYYKPFTKYAIPEKIKIYSRSSSLNYGIGGYILALNHIAELTGEKKFLEDIKKILQAIEVPRSLPDGECDVMGGYAGLAIALGKVFNKVEGLLPLAELISEKLLYYKPTLTGFGHGAAGIALSLAVLGNILKTSKFDKKIIELLEWENRYFDYREENWIDLRDPEHPGFMFGICSGAPGIGISRNELCKYTQNEKIIEICRKDVEIVKHILITHKDLRRDCLCCGNCARIVAASRLGITTEKAYESLLERVEKDQVNIYHIADTCDFIPGLMQGYAGIGYTIVMYGDERSGGMLV